MRTHTQFGSIKTYNRPSVRYARYAKSPIPTIPNASPFLELAVKAPNADWWDTGPPHPK